MLSYCVSNTVAGTTPASGSANHYHRYLLFLKWNVLSTHFVVFILGTLQYLSTACKSVRFSIVIQALTYSSSVLNINCCLDQLIKSISVNENRADVIWQLKRSKNRHLFIIFIISLVQIVHVINNIDRRTEQSAQTQLPNNVWHIASSKNTGQTSQAVTNHYTFLQETSCLYNNTSFYDCNDLI